MEPSVRAKNDLGTRSALFDVGANVIDLSGSLPDAPGAIARFLAKRGEGLYALAFIVDDLEKAIEELKSKNISVALTEIAPGLPSAWINPSCTGGVLYELLTEDTFAKLRLLPKDPYATA